jgi:tight adherence protein B
VTAHRHLSGGPRRAVATVALVALVALACLLGVPASSSAAALRLSEGGGASFPSRSLVLSVPGRSSVAASEIHVNEDGRPVSGAIAKPIARAGAGDFGVVLAIDVSPSMKGAPLDRAMAAARALAAQRTGNQELAVVTFDQSAKVALPLTDDPRAIAAALARTPPVGHGAYIYNALTVAAQQLADAKIAAGAVILLSDGASVGATPRPGHNLTASSVGMAASAAHAQIYTVGLRDSSYTPARMSLLARVGGGAFIESSSSQLASVFTRIEAGLTSAYVVRYRSTAPRGRQIVVSVAVDGVPDTATLSYDSPPAAAPTPSTKPARSKSFWISSASVVAASFAAALLLGLGMFALLSTRVRRGGLRGRVGEFTATPTAAARDLKTAPSAPELPVVERALQRLSWWPAFREDVELARIDRSPTQLVTITALATIAAAVLLGLALGNPLPSLLALGCGPLALRSIVKHRLTKQRELFAEQLPALIQELASAMRAGHSLVAGLTSMARSAPEPSRAEWTRVLADEQLGRPLEEAMEPLIRRMDSSDISQVALVAALQQRTGGNMAEVLERVADSVRERQELRRELKALTAQARLSRWVVTALPPLVAGAIAVINPHYIEPLFTTSTGVTLLFICAGLLTCASLVMRAITNIKA